MYVSKINVNGATYRINDKLRFINSNKIGGYGGLSGLSPNEIVKIVVIKDGDGDVPLIGIVPVSGERLEGWHDLDDNIRDRNGYYIEKHHLTRNFRLEVHRHKMIVGDSFAFKQRELKDMECKVLSPMPGNKESVVEFKEDIGGCGADGLGKAGYCLVIPNKILKPVKKEDKSKQKSKVNNRKPLTDDF